MTGIASRQLDRVTGRIPLVVAIFLAAAGTAGAGVAKVRRSSSAAGSGGGASRSIACGQTIDGALDPSDVQLDDGTWVDDYTFTLTEETSVTLSMSADAFAPYLFLEDDQGNGVVQQRRRVTQKLPAGTYVVFPNNFDPLESGSYPYRLTLHCEPVREVECGQTAEGSLDPADFELPDGTWEEAYHLTLTQEVSVTAIVRTDSFDPYVVLEDGENNSVAQAELRITQRLQPGSYVLFANNFEPLAAGSYPYRLVVHCAPVVEIACGQTIRGSLDPSDYKLADGTWEEPYYLTLSTPANVTLSMTAERFAPYVFLEDADNNSLAAGEPPITEMLAAGDYIVFANNADPLPDGSYPYDLSVECVGSAGCPGDCDGSGDVVVSELIRGVNIALGSADLASCSAFDRDGDGAVAVSELVQAVNAALGGCRG